MSCDFFHAVLESWSLLTRPPAAGWLAAPIPAPILLCDEHTAGGVGEGETNLQLPPNLPWFP